MNDTVHAFVADPSGHCVTCGLVPRLHDGPIPLVAVDQPGRAHRDAGPTEHAAAKRIELKSGTQRVAVLRALFLAPDGLNDDEIARATGLDRYSAAPRRGELVDGGYAEDSGTHRPSAHGNPASVWILTEEGVRVAGGFV